jgi:hypothetical protein
MDLTGTKKVVWKMQTIQWFNMKNNGSAAFGPWIGGDQSAGAKKNDIVKLQRQIMSNGLILDYEKKVFIRHS